MVYDWVPAYKELKSSRETAGKIHKRSTAADRTGCTHTTVAGLVLATCPARPRSYPHYLDATKHLILLALHPSFSHFSPTSIQVISHLHCSCSFLTGLPASPLLPAPRLSIPSQTILHPAARIMCLNTHHNFIPVQNPPKFPISRGIQNRSLKGPESLGSSPDYRNNFLSYYFPVKWSAWSSWNAIRLSQGFWGLLCLEHYSPTSHLACSLTSSRLHSTVTLLKRPSPDHTI